MLSVQIGVRHPDGLEAPEDRKDIGFQPERQQIFAIHIKISRFDVLSGNLGKNRPVMFGLLCCKSLFPLFSSGLGSCPAPKIFSKQPRRLARIRVLDNPAAVFKLVEAHSNSSLHPGLF